MENNTLLFAEIPGPSNKIGEIILNRSQVLNALSHNMIQTLDHQLEQWAKADHIKAVIIRSNNKRAFCAGGDIREIYTRGKIKPADALTFFRDEYQLIDRMYHYPKPYIAFLDGLTMGGGAGVSINGSHRIATENLIFAMPETDIGFFPDIGGSYFLSRCPGYTGIYLGLTGTRLTTADAFELGLVNYFVPSHQLENVMHDINSLEKCKTLPAKMRPLLNPYREEIDRCFSATIMEEILDRLREKNTEWHKKTISSLQKKSPTSLKVTLRQLQKGRQMDFHACIEMEYNLAKNFLENSDFYEGIRAMIIDKDRTPRWKPNTLALVTEQQVDRYFTHENTISAPNL